MDKGKQAFGNLLKTGFVRSVILRVLSISIIFSIAIAAIAFYSFASEIRKNVISDRKKQLSSVEHTISMRMNEINSIAYNISTDPAFLLEPVDDTPYSSYEMSNTLEKYLVGNSFIEHLSYYRLSEPDKIYVSSGERSLKDFFKSFGMSDEAVAENIEGIISSKRTAVKTVSYGSDASTYFAYVYPLPQLSENPQAFVLMLIPVKEIEPMLTSLFTNTNGEVAVFDSNGSEVFRTGELDDEVPLDEYIKSGNGDEKYKTESGAKYIMQKVVSESNGWSYISVIKQSDTLSGLANKQLIFIVLILLIMFVAIIIMLLCIIVQYKPISTLAATVSGNSEGADIDERVLLSDKIAALTDDSEQKQHFESAYYEAQAASKAKSAFLSNMSHDIRTPMNAVIGMTAIALKHADDPDYVRDCLGKVQVSSRYLLDIINNVLDMSRIESGRLTLTEDVIHLPTLIDSLVALIEPTAEIKKQVLSVDYGKLANENVTGDSLRLTQVFINILSNSVKFTPNGGSIHIQVHQTETDDSECGDFVFSFSDTGVGMSQEFIGKVFDTFSRAENDKSSKTEGTGLGMAIAKNLVELMGGTIMCESEPGNGTTFTVTMHMKFACETVSAQSGSNYPNANHESNATEAGTTPNFSGKKVLLVEDNAINLEIANSIISETGAEVAQATNGEEAVNAFKQSDVGYFDVILMDLQMPVMNGYEATAIIRALNRADAKAVPIFAMTANTFDEDVRQVKDAGMNGHIGKPYTPDTLYRVLSRTFTNG